MDVAKADLQEFEWIARHRSHVLEILTTESLRWDTALTLFFVVLKFNAKTVNTKMFQAHSPRQPVESQPSQDERTQVSQLALNPERVSKVLGFSSVFMDQFHRATLEARNHL